MDKAQQRVKVPTSQPPGEQKREQQGDQKNLGTSSGSTGGTGGGFDRSGGGHGNGLNDHNEYVKNNEIEEEQENMF